MTCSVPDYEVRNVFNKYGRVQSVIVNKDKRHAFVKMITREDAERSKRAMDDSSQDPTFRVCSITNYPFLGVGALLTLLL